MYLQIQHKWTARNHHDDQAETQALVFALQQAHEWWRRFGLPPASGTARKALGSYHTQPLVLPPDKTHRCVTWKQLPATDCFFFFKEIIYTGSLIFLSTSKNEAPIRRRPEGVCQIWSTEGGPLATARLKSFKSGTLITTSGPKSLSSHRNASKACACFWKLYSHFTYSQNLTRAHCRIMQEICKFHQGVILCFFTHYCIMPRQNTNVCTVLK